MSSTLNVHRVRAFVANRLPVFIYCLVGLALLAQGARYLNAEELMPYHLAVTGAPWDSLGQSQQTLLLGLLKGFGAGSLCAGLAILVLALIPLRAGSNWSRWATPALAATYTGLLVYVTNFALLAGATPITVTAVLFGLVIAASVFSLLGIKEPGTREQV